MASFAPTAQRVMARFSGSGSRSIRRRFAAWRIERRRQANLARELASLSDRELTDLGIGRGDFPDIIRGTYRR